MLSSQKAKSKKLLQGGGYWEDMTAECNVESWLHPGPEKAQ